jgi:hypothetical protein
MVNGSLLFAGERNLQNLQLKPHVGAFFWRGGWRAECEEVLEVFSFFSRREFCAQRDTAIREELIFGLHREFFPKAN